MSMKFLGGINHLAINRMRLAFMDLHNAGLVVRSTNNYTLAYFTRVTFFTHI